MKITLVEARRIAHLAHLQFADADLERMRGNLDQILGYVEKLDVLDTVGIEPVVGPPSLEGSVMCRLRDDAPGATLSTEDALADAPESGRGHFKVPRIIG